MTGEILFQSMVRLIWYMTDQRIGSRIWVLLVLVY